MLWNQPTRGAIIPENMLLSLIHQKLNSYSIYFLIFLGVSSTPQKTNLLSLVNIPSRGDPRSLVSEWVNALGMEKKLNQATVQYIQLLAIPSSVTKKKKVSLPIDKTWNSLQLVGRLNLPITSNLGGYW